MVAGAAIVLLVIIVIAVILFVITLALFIATANEQPSGTDKTSLLAAGAMIGISIPIIVVAAVFGVLYFTNLAKGKRSAGYLWLFIILSIVSGLMVIIASIIGFVIANQLSDTTQQRNLRAAGAMGLIGSGFFVIAFIVLVAIRRKAIPVDERKNYVGHSRERKQKEHGKQKEPKKSYLNTRQRAPEKVEHSVPQESHHVAEPAVQHSSPQAVSHPVSTPVAQSSDHWQPHQITTNGNTTTFTDNRNTTTLLP